MSTKREVLLVGFGAVGATYAMIMQKSGKARVTAVARSNYKDIQDHGMHIKSIKFGDIPAWKPDSLVHSLDEAAKASYDYIVVTTKAIPELSKTPELLAPFLTESYAAAHAQPVFVLMQNGLNVEIDLYNALKALGKGEPKIISTAVWIGVNLVGTDVVKHSALERMSVGMYRHENRTTTTNTPAEDAILEDFASLIKGGGSVIEIVSEIQRVKFKKNMWNAGFAAFCSLTGYPLPSIWRAPPTDSQSYSPYVEPTTADYINKYTIANVKAILDELLKLGRALGFDEDALPTEAAESTFELTKKLHVEPTSTHRPSMLLDAESGRPFEVEVIVGEVVRMAQRLNVDLPRIEMMYAMLLVKQNQIIAQTKAKK